MRPSLETVQWLPTSLWLTLKPFVMGIIGALLVAASSIVAMLIVIPIWMATQTVILVAGPFGYLSIKPPGGAHD